MRIGLNALYLVPGQVGGVETYLRRLVAGFQGYDTDDEYVLYTNRENAGSFPLGPRFQERRCEVRARSKVERILYEQIVLPRRARADAIDVLHSPCYTAPLRCPCASVVTIHDMNFHFFPEDWSSTALVAHRFLIPRVARASDAILTGSETSKMAICAVLGVAAQRVTVVYHGVDGNLVDCTEQDVARVRAKFAGGGEYLFSVSASHPHKNLGGLLRAYEEFAAALEGEPPPLVITGIRGREHEAMARRAESVGGRVVMAGWVDAVDLAALYRGARAFVLASRYEGFGLPVLEAMWAGVPVASSNAAALSEIVGDGALTFDPSDVGAMASALARVWRDDQLRQSLVRRGRARVETFLWRRAVAETLAVYSAARVAHRD